MAQSLNFTAYAIKDVTCDRFLGGWAGVNSPEWHHLPNPPLLYESALYAEQVRRALPKYLIDRLRIVAIKWDTCETIGAIVAEEPETQPFGDID